MEEVHQDKEHIPAARQPSKTNQPTNQSLLLVFDYQGTKFVQVLQISDLPSCPKTATFACW